MKGDDGTEHSLIESIHIYLRSLNNDTGYALNSFSIVSFPVNQRIDSLGILLIKICFWQTWLVEIIFSGYGRFGNT